MVTLPRPGWYADPVQRAELRWYDGATWTAYVRTGARTWTDPLAPDGTPLARRSGMGPGAKAAIWIVSVSVALLSVVAVAALVTIARNLPRLTGDQIARQVSASMSKQYRHTVKVTCPSVSYIDGWDGAVECTATGVGSAPVRVEVTVRNARVHDWTVLTDASPD